MLGNAVVVQLHETALALFMELDYPPYSAFDVGLIVVHDDRDDVVVVVAPRLL